MRKLIGVKRNHIDTGVDQFSTEVIRPEEILQNVVCMTAKPQRSKDRRDARPFVARFCGEADSTRDLK